MVIKNYIVGNWTTETSPVGYERALKVFTDVENIEIDCTQSSSALLPLVYSCIVHQQQEWANEHCPIQTKRAPTQKYCSILQLSVKRMTLCHPLFTCKVTAGGTHRVYKVYILERFCSPGQADYKLANIVRMQKVTPTVVRKPTSSEISQMAWTRAWMDTAGQLEDSGYSVGGIQRLDQDCHSGGWEDTLGPGRKSRQQEMEYFHILLISVNWGLALTKPEVNVGQ